MLKYQHDDEIFFNSLFDRADKLSEVPLQQMLIFFKLPAEAMGELTKCTPRLPGRYAHLCQSTAK